MTFACQNYNQAAMQYNMKNKLVEARKKKELFTGMVVIQIFICLIFLSLFACINQNERSSSFNETVIDLTEAIYKPILYSEVFEKIEYIPLETTKDCLIGNHTFASLTDKYIVIFSVQTQCAYMFDRDTGKFIKQIGSRGQGPNEYAFSSIAFCDENESILYFDRTTDWIGYHLETGNSQVVKQPITFSKVFFDHTSSYSVIKKFVSIDTNTYVGFVNNISGHDSIRMVVFDKEGNIKKTFPNFQTFEPSNQLNNESFFSFKPIIGQYYQYQSSVYFKEEYNDTIYKISTDSISPHFSFFLGNKRLPYQLLGTYSKDIHDYYRIFLIGESDKYIFFNYSYNRKTQYGYFDKVKKQSFVSNSFEDGEGVFINDLDNMPSTKFRVINKKGEFSGFLRAEKVTEFINTNRRSNLKLENLSNIKDDDNPILVIATPKK